MYLAACIHWLYPVLHPQILLLSTGFQNSSAIYLHTLGFFIFLLLILSCGTEAFFLQELNLDLPLVSTNIVLILSRCSKMEYLTIKHRNLWTYYLVVISQLHLGLLSFSFSCQHEQGLVVHTSSSYPYHLSYLPQNLHQQSDSGPVK